MERNHLSSYVVLKKRVHQTLLIGQERIEEERVQTYWQTGKLIDGHILQHKDRADYGTYVIKKLAADLDLSSRLLYEVLQFFRQGPIVRARAQLNWTHYRALLRLPDKDTQQRMLHGLRMKN